MNIYFVNRYSKLKGPFDIIDSNRQHLIKVGDICLRDTVEGVAFYVVYNSSNSWDSCKVVGFGENDTLSEIGNTLLFSFDGLSRRKGDVALIKQIRMCFREKVIDEFFCNAVEILDYKKDFWEGSLFPQFFAPSQEFVDRNKQKKLEVSNETNHCPSIFAQYLGKELLELLIASLNDGNELKEAYQILRKKHPEMFRKALMQFLTENPSGTIFDKPADAYVPTVNVTEVEIPKATSQHDKLFEVSERIDDEPFETNERIDRYLGEIGCEILLSVEEEIELVQKIRKGDIDARNLLVRANLRFVVGLAKQYLHKGVEFEDLLHEGFLGLIKATERFDETRGFKFISYAAWWIKRYLTDAIVKDSSLIQFPLNLHILHKRIWNFKARYEHINGFPPPITEIEVGDEENLERISFLDSLPNNLKNICIPCEDLDTFEDNHNDIWDYDESEYKKQYVRSMLNHLSKREREILIRAYGIGVREETLEAIGESRGLTRERVRQIKEKAIRKLRDMTSGNEKKDDETLEDVAESIEAQTKLKAMFDTLINRTKKSPNLDKNAYSKRTDKQMDEKSHFALKDVAPKENVVERCDVKEFDGLKVDDVILYKDKICIVTKIIIQGNASKLVIKYENDVLDVVNNDKSKYKILSSVKNIETSNVVKEVNESQTENNNAKQEKEALFDYYVEKISKMKQAIVKGEKVLAKPTLLLAIIDGISEGKILHNDIVLTKWLEEKYYMQLLHYSKATQILNPTGIEKPFWHLQSDGFWHLKYPQSLYKNNMYPTKTWILTNVECAWFDDDLWSLLQDKEWRQKIRKFLIDNKLTQKSYKSENKNEREIEFPFLPLQFHQEEKREKKEKYPQSESKFSLVTPLSYLVGHKIITKKQLKHCHKKGLQTIGDVVQIIEKYHLTSDSTRFTKYTIDMWFSIVDFAKANGVKIVNVGSTINKKNVKNTNNVKTEDEIEIVYVDIPSANPYTDIEIPQQETDDVEFE